MPRRWLAASHARWQPRLNGQAFQALTLTDSATSATEILARGGTAQDAADILGISVAIVLKHYAKWSQGRQERITKLFEAVYPGTYWAHDEKGTVIS